MNHELRNIHLLCASNTVSAVQMMGPIVNELSALEQGVEVFDEKTQESVVVVAPVLAIMCDNPRASQIVGHMTGNPSKLCRVCLVSFLYTDSCFNTIKVHHIPFIGRCKGIT